MCVRAYAQTTIFFQSSQADEQQQLTSFSVSGTNFPGLASLTSKSLSIISSSTFSSCIAHGFPSTSSSLLPNHNIHHPTPPSKHVFDRKQITHLILDATSLPLSLAPAGRTIFIYFICTIALLYLSIPPAQVCALNLFQGLDARSHQEAVFPAVPLSLFSNDSSALGMQNTQIYCLFFSNPSLAVPSGPAPRAVFLPR